jgi:2-polyprenyl-3-methyl-5-hydroxy-6-metoxy-1,4-benzoquinol methylase
VAESPDPFGVAKGVSPWAVVGYNRRVLRLLCIALVIGGLGCGKRGEQPPRDAGPRDAAAADASADASMLELEQKRFDEERRPDLIVAALGLHPGARVADVGAGSGLLTVHLARAVLPGGKVVATDIATAVLELLAERLAANKLTEAVEARLVEPDQPGLEDGGYDAILLAEVDNYLADPTGWLVAAKAALKPGGAIAITNRIYHRARGLAAAKAAGLHLVSESTPVPSTFIAVFRAELPAKAPPASPRTSPTPPAPAPAPPAAPP